MGIKFKIIISAIIIVVLLAGLTISYFLFSDIESKETKEIKESCNVEVERFMGRKIFIIKPKEEVVDEKIILYFHRWFIYGRDELISLGIYRKLSLRYKNDSNNTRLSINT